MSSGPSDRGTPAAPSLSGAPSLDHLLSMCLALAEQLAIANERHDTLIQVLAAKGLVDPEELAVFQPTPEAEQARNQQHQELVRELLKVLSDELDNREKSDGKEPRG